MVKAFVISRLKEASTWRGIILMISGIIGYNLDTEQQAVLITLAIALVGAIGAFMPDRISPAPEPPKPTEKLPESPRNFEQALGERDKT